MEKNKTRKRKTENLIKEKTKERSNSVEKKAKSTKKDKKTNSSTSKSKKQKVTKVVKDIIISDDKTENKTIKIKEIKKGSSPLNKEISIYSWNVNGLRAVIDKGELEKFINAGK